MSRVPAALVRLSQAARVIAIGGARPAAAVLAAALLASAGFGAWKLLDWLNDREAVGAHEAQVRAEVSEAELEAERSANRNDQARRAVRESRTDALRHARENQIDEPETRLVAGPAVRAVMRELRAQAWVEMRDAP